MCIWPSLKKCVNRSSSYGLIHVVIVLWFKKEVFFLSLKSVVLFGWIRGLKFLGVACTSEAFYRLSRSCCVWFVSSTSSSLWFFLALSCNAGFWNL